MNIKAKVYPTQTGKIKAYASITFDDCFVVTGLKVMEGKNGLFVTMPSKKVEEEYKDICYPVTKEMRQEIQDAVLSAYAGKEDKKKDNEQSGFDLIEDDDDLPF